MTHNNFHCFISSSNLIPMDLSFKKVLAGVSATAIALTQIGTAMAAFSDVPSGVWYGEAVKAFTDAGYLDATQTHFRGGDLANRAEFIKLVVELNGGVLSTPPATPTFTDVAASAWYYSYMEEAAKEGWVKGDGNCVGSKPCYARPGANINRAEAAALIVRAFALEATGDAKQFVDNTSGQWYTDAIQTAADHCVLQGDDSTGRVRPSDNMNRAEMVVMLHRVDQGLTYGVDCGRDQSAAAGIRSATATDLKTVEVEFTVPVDQKSAEMMDNYKVAGASDVKITDAKLVEDKVVRLTVDSDLSSGSSYTVTVSNVMSKEGKEISDSATFKGYQERVMGNGTLEVGLSSTNPVADTVPRGANGVAMLSLDLKASCDDDVVIDNLTVLHEGFGATTDITGVYVASDGARLTRKRVLDSQDQTADIRFLTPFRVPKCSTKTLDVVADFNTAATVSAEHNLVVELASDVASNAKSVDGNFPLRGNTFKVAAVTSGIVTVTSRTVSPSNLKVGDKQVALGRFEIAANAVEDQTIYSMTLDQAGTASDGDVTNLKIRRTDSTVVSKTVTAFANDKATFVFDPPLTVKKGDTVIVEVVGDVTGGAAKNVKLRLEETSDIFAVGALYGFGRNGQLYGSQVVNSTSSATTVSIDAGQFTIQLDGPVQQSYSRTSKDAVLGNVNFQLGGGDAVNIKKLYFAIEGETASGNSLNYADNTYDRIDEVLNSVKLRDIKTGKSISATPVASAAGVGSSNLGTYQIYEVDDLTLNSDANYELRVNFIDNGASNNPKSGEQFRIHICGEPTELSSGTNLTGCSFAGLLGSAVTTYNMEIEGVSTGDSVTDVRPRGVLSGNFHRIATPSLTVALRATGTSDIAVKNTKDVVLNRFEIRAGESDDVRLTRLVFASQSGSLNNAQNYTLWVDSDGDGKVDTISKAGAAPASSKVTFTSLKTGTDLVKKEQTVVYEVHADIVSNLTNNDLALKFSDSDSDYIEAMDSVRGSSLSGIRTNGTCTPGTCDITVTTVTTKNYVLVSQGNLYVSLDTTPIRNRQLLGGALGDPALRVQFRSEYEDVDVTDIQVNSSGSTATSVDRLELYKDGASTPFATATVGACGSDDTLGYNAGSAGGTSAFCAQLESRQLIVPKGQEVDVLVRPRIKTDVEGAISNETIAFFLNSQAVANNTTGSGAVRARGAQSSNTLSANGGDSNADGEIFIGRTSAASTNAVIAGNKHVTVLSKIQSIVNANPDANGTNVPTGVRDIGQFKISAMPNGNSQNGLNKVTLSGVIFNVNATNVLLDSSAFKFFNKANASVTASCTAVNTSGTAIVTTSGSFLVACNNLMSGSVDTSIDQGSDATFVLQGSITNPKTGTTTSSLQVSLQNFTQMSNTTYGPSTTASHFAWMDKDNSASTTGRFYWVEYPDTSVNSTSYQS